MSKLVVILFIFFSTCVFSQGWITPGQSWAFVGPMIHFNFGGGEHHLSLVLEGSYWKDVLMNSNAPFLGVDAGFEYEIGGKWRFYSEAQTGGILGLSAGPVLEVSDGRGDWGIQSSVWYCFIVGLDMRWRYTDRSYWSPGVFGKLPLPIQK